MKIRFIEDREVLDGAGRVIQAFAAGEEYDLSPPSARRWLRRRVAEEVRAAASAEVRKTVTEPEPGEAQRQPAPIGSEAGEAQPSSSSQAAPASPNKTWKPSDGGAKKAAAKRGRPRKGGS